MKKLLSAMALGIFFSVSFSAPVYAIGFKSAETLIIEEDLADDHYFSAGKAVIESNTFGDLYIAGGDITVNGNVSGDLVVVGGRVVVMGDVGDDLRILGGQVSVYGSVGDDLIALGGQIDVSKDSIIGGSVVGGSGYLTLDGEVKEDVQGGMGMFILNGKVDGDVIVTVEEKLDVSENAIIGGNLKYSALLDMKIPGGVVSGEITFNQFETDEALEDVTNAYWGFRIISYLSALLVALLLVIFAPMTLLRSAEISKTDPLKSLGVGILVLIATFIGAFLLMVTIVGVPLGLIIFAFLFIAFYFAKIFACAWLADYVFKFKKRKKHLKLYLFFGIALALLAYYLVALIPFIGWLVSIILFLVGFGGMVLLKKEQFATLKAKKLV